jgi:uncharacterized protein YggU (UPF0235/DUF167 family)
VTAVAVDPPSLTVRVRARAHDGEANAAAIRVLSGALGLPRAAVTIWRGAAARNKLVRVDLAPADLQSRLATILETIQPRKTGS